MHRPNHCHSNQHPHSRSPMVMTSTCPSQRPSQRLARQHPPRCRPPSQSMWTARPLLRHPAAAASTRPLLRRVGRSRWHCRSSRRCCRRWRGRWYPTGTYGSLSALARLQGWRYECTRACTIPTYRRVSVKYHMHHPGGVWCAHWGRAVLDGGGVQPLDSQGRLALLHLRCGCYLYHRAGMHTVW